MTALPGKRAVGPIEADGVALRLLEAGDLPMTLAWRNEDHIRQWFFASQVIAPEQHWVWWERYRTRDDDFVFIIEETVTLKRPVGQVALYNIDWSRRRAEFGRLLIGDNDARGLGLGRLACASLVEFGFAQWDLREIYLEVLANNLPAIAIYRDCGFSETHRLADRIVMTKRRTPSLP